MTPLDALGTVPVYTLPLLQGPRGSAGVFTPSFTSQPTNAHANGTQRPPPTIWMVLVKGGIWPPPVPLWPLWRAQGSHREQTLSSSESENFPSGREGKPSAPAAQPAWSLCLHCCCFLPLVLHSCELGVHTASTGVSSAHFSWAQLRFHGQHLLPLGQEHTGTPLRGYPSLCVPLCTPHLWLKDRSANLGVLTEVTK